MAYKAKLTSTGPYVAARPKATSWKPSANNGWVIGAATPTAAAAPTATPAAPPAAPSVPPPDATYEQQMGLLAKNRDTTFAGLTADRTRGLSDYGYSENSAGALAFDPTNPYSQAALMKQKYDQSRRGTGNTMAARGQLYAGAYQNAQDQTYRQQGQSENALQKALIRFLAANASAKTKAGTDYEMAAAGAKGDSVARMLAQG